MSQYEISKKQGVPDTSILKNDIDPEMDPMFKTMLKIDTDDVVYVKNCRLCNSALRFEAEEHWETQGCNYSDTTRFLNDEIDAMNSELPLNEREKRFTIASVRNHISNHFLDQSKQMRLREYADNIQDLMKSKRDRAQRVAMLLAVCEQRLADVVTINTDGSTKEEKEKTDTIAKIVSTMISAIDAQQKVEGEVSTADVVMERLKDVFIQKINNEESEAKKRIMFDTFQDFVNSIKE